MSLCYLRDLKALSSTLASLRMLQPRAFGSLKKRRDHWTKSPTDLEYSNCNHVFDKGTRLLLHFASFSAQYWTYL